MSIDQNLDEIIKARRSIRLFTSEMPTKEDIKAIIQAGVLAPFAGLANTGKDGRKFIVVSRNNPLINQLSSVVKNRAGVFAEQFNAQTNSNPILRAQGQGFLKRLEMTAQQGPLGIGSAPYYIVVAEKRGIPDVQHKSLAHCMENMWLKATALGLGFHLVTITTQMEQDNEFCNLLSLPFGEYRLDGCAIGFPAQNPPQPIRSSIDDVTTWFL
ncbi:nitroreductase [Desulfosporosinus acidiphilus SJ4]|uniref:Nitroreductase n=1 Tax=Desulfosporosinus acidiphilus (strain DSM 22704 / JCM 16185 / SJ4) TaxID=646529 RepID=I4D2L9_DESAJ|nr:nitroreductase family protein [Desulfosporosinus acidiphilus]AFM40043.1 nitroreductase [Desulfosporosinus acidiphilus SJ4]